MRPRTALFALLASAAAGWLIAHPSPAVAPILPAVLSVAFVALVVRTALPSHPVEDRRAMIYWTAASFCIHFVVGVLVTVFTSAWKYLGPDALYYQLNAHSLAAHWNGIEPAVPAELTPGKEGFPFPSVRCT